MALAKGAYCGFEVAVSDPGITLVTFNEPDRLNGFTIGLKRDLVEVVRQVQMDDDVRVLVLTGTGRAFSAGDDISGGDAFRSARATIVPEIHHGHHNELGTYNALRWVSQALNSAVRDLDKLTIAALNGYAIQTGFSLALCCDFRIAATEARMGSATLRFGLLPDEGGQWLLVRTLGLARAMDFLMRKRIVDAGEALELGLVHEVVAPDRLLETAMELATELATGPQAAMRSLKRAMYNAAELTWPQALDDIAARTAWTDYHPDAREGMAAFGQKRDPHFNAWLEE
jgi:2-(1,2-epoxy-1,2-dihydrophenyl)acetyl-CoA isomerase